MGYAFQIHLFHHLLALSANYLELKSESPEPVPTYRVAIPPRMEGCPPRDTYQEIPVRASSNGPPVQAKVSMEDWERLSAFSKDWRLSAHGYVMCYRNRKPYYMHKMVLHDLDAIHINGDKLDNRRCNLQPPTFCLHSATLDLLPPDSPLGIGIRSYGEEKRYEGAVVQNRPHGFGILYESQKQTLGWWQDGELYTGIVMEYKPLPTSWIESSTPQLIRSWLLLRGVRYTPT